MKRDTARRSRVCLLLLALLPGAGAQADTLRVAVAASMKAAFTELAADFSRTRPGDTLDATYGASGKFAAQIANGAPFEMFFSADTEFPERLVAGGHTVGKPRTYALGHLALWSRNAKTGTLPLKKLPTAIAGKFAIANPATAPYGRRAQEALQHEGVWETLQPRLVFGENIAQTAQFVDTGAADAGLVALSLVVGPELKTKGSWTRIPDDWHSPLEHAYVVLRPGAGKPLPSAFATYIGSPAARTILARYGFDAPR